MASVDFSSLVKPETKRVALLIVASLTHPTKPIRSSVLTREGERLAKKAGEEYSPLCDSLAKKFGPPSYYSAYNIASMLTAYYLSNALEIQADESLDPVLTFDDIDCGGWVRGFSTKTNGFLLSRFFSEGYADADQQRMSKQGLELFIGTGGDRFKIGIVLEPTLTMGLLDYLPKTDYGIEPCQGVMVQSDKTHILAADKIIPACAKLK